MKHLWLRIPGIDSSVAGQSAGLQDDWSRWRTPGRRIIALVALGVLPATLVVWHGFVGIQGVAIVCTLVHAYAIFVALARRPTGEIPSDDARLGPASRSLQSQKREAVSQLAGGVAHNFNNLLIVITGYGEILLGNPNLDAESRDAATQIRSAALRAARLTEQLQVFSGTQPLQPQPLNLNDFVEGLGETLDRLLCDSIELQVDLDASISQIDADPAGLQHAIVNLVINARDAMPEGGLLKISTHARMGRRDLDVPEPGVDVERSACVSVSDSGLGMTPEIEDRIFDPFFTTRVQGQGTGLGLAMVCGFAQQSGGRVEVESAPGHGTTFEIFLPVTSEQTEAADVDESAIAWELPLRESA